MKENEINKLLNLLKDESVINLKIIEPVKVESKIEDIFTITSYAEVCNELGEVQSTCPYTKIKQIEKLFNQGWKPNWDDSNEYKYFPWFERRAGGWVFVSSSYSYSLSIGQPGFYKSSQISDHIGKYFLDIYKSILG